MRDDWEKTLEIFQRRISLLRLRRGLYMEESIFSAQLVEAGFLVDEDDQRYKETVDRLIKQRNHLALPGRGSRLVKSFPR